MGSPQDLTASQMAMTVLFGSAMVTYLGLEASRLRVLLRDSVDPSIRIGASKHSEPLSFTFPSLYAFFRDMSALGVILLLAFMCEKYPIYAQGGKEWDRDMYWFLTLLLLVASLMTMKKGKSTDILNRDQTEEWKGWMQFMFLFYHYFHAEEVYNAIRVMITCYVWMTGFGNFSFFYIKQDFGFVRFIQMLWRLNFLVTLLMMSQGNTYILYYICPLHTFYFGLVYLTMRVGPHLNHGKWDIRLKLFVVACLIYLIWDCLGGQLFSILFGPFLSNNPVIGAKSGSLWEWYFRSSLDHWSTLLGMIFALNFPLASRWLNKVEEQSFSQQLVIKGLVGVLVGTPFLWWATSIFPNDKMAYNHTNSYFGFIPLVAYVYFRNITPGLRIWYSGILHDIGKVTLETYLMQHHIWLTSNAKTLLVLVPNYPKCNLVLCTVLFVYLSRQMFYITMSLRGMVLPDDRRRCIAGAIATVAVIGSLYGLGWVLSLIGLGFSTAAMFASITGAITLGIVHGRLNLNLWGAARAGPSGSGGLTGIRAPSSPESARSLSRIILTILGVGFLLTLPLKQPGGGSGAAVPSSTKKPHNLAISPSPSMSSSKPASCVKLINEGEWRTVTEWQWKTGDEATVSCGFHTLSVEDMRSLYAGKGVVIVGDSIGRKYYYQLLAALGHPSSSAHNESMEQHQDLHYQDPANEVSGIRISFLWRPYAKEIAAQLDTWQPTEHSPSNYPDVLLLSLGLWDTLHQTPKEEVKKELGHIAEGLKALPPSKTFRSWLLPTEIVDEKLLTEEKKAHMKEVDVAHFRNEALASGLPKEVNAIIDGAKVSKGLPKRSVDGVHYDDQLYDVLVQVGANALAVYEKEVISSSSSSSDKKKPAAAAGGEGEAKKEINRRRRKLVVDVEDWEEWIDVDEEEASSVVQQGFFHRLLKATGGARKIDGTMSSPFYGAITLVIVALMLVTMDVYAGFSFLALCLSRSDVRVTWEESYEPMLRKILGSVPAVEVSSGIGGGGGGRGRYTPVPQEVELGDRDAASSTTAANAHVEE